VLSITSGMAEALLTSGVFFRLDRNSAVKTISPSIASTQVELERGRAAVEVDELYPQSLLEIVDGGVNTQLVKTGYYEFGANNPTVEVFTGKAAVQAGDGRYKVVKAIAKACLPKLTLSRPSRKAGIQLGCAAMAPMMHPRSARRRSALPSRPQPARHCCRRERRQDHVSALSHLHAELGDEEDPAGAPARSRPSHDRACGPDTHADGHRDDRRRLPFNVIDDR